MAPGGLEEGRTRGGLKSAESQLDAKVLEMGGGDSHTAM